MQLYMLVNVQAYCELQGYEAKGCVMVMCRCCEDIVVCCCLCSC